MSELTSAVTTVEFALGASTALAFQDLIRRVIRARIDGVLGPTTDTESG